MATVSFLASRTVPTGGFWVALAGGVALARVAERRGTREGYGASAAATLETVAIMGPTRFGVPFTQALSAPMLGRLHARGASFAAQLLACTLVRVLSNAAGVAFFIWVIAGGLDAYAGAYDAVADRVGIEVGERETLLLTIAGLLGWGVFASWVQVGVYRRGLDGWSPAGGAAAQPDADRTAAPHRGRFDPRFVVLAAAVAFGVLLSDTSWPLLGAVTVWLSVAWATCRPDWSFVLTGLGLVAVLGGGAFLFTLVGGLGIDEALRRGSRATLLVVVATWLRAAAGAEGLREVSRRALGRLGWLPAARETARTLEAIGSEGRLVASGRALLDELSGVPKRPVAVLDAVLAWVQAEVERFRPARASAALQLRARAWDVALVAAAGMPVLVLSARGP